MNRIRSAWRAVLLALAALSVVVGGMVALDAAPAGADTQIGWVLDNVGSAQCVVAAGTNNHVICRTFPVNAPPTDPGTIVLNGWFHAGCLGGAYMVAGSNTGQLGNPLAMGTPAKLVLQNVAGIYCGVSSESFPGGGDTVVTLMRGTCWPAWAAPEGQVNLDSTQLVTGFWTHYVRTAAEGNYYPHTNYGSVNFPTSGCGWVGASSVTFNIWY